MIKKIHYIWLGSNPKSRLIKKCIKSWKKHMPDWEIIEWNESNLNIDINKYCRQAYDEKKYAFASDVLRFDVLYREGGLYFDTDVKMLKSFEPIVCENEFFSGFEMNNRINPGLVMYSRNPGNEVIKEVLDNYQNEVFEVKQIEKMKVVGDYFYDVISKYGFKLNDTYQKYHNVTIFPSTYFSPTDGIRSILNYTENTYSEHLFAGSWLGSKTRKKNFVRKFFYVLFKPSGVKRLKKIFGWRKNND